MNLSKIENRPASTDTQKVSQGGEHLDLSVVLPVYQEEDVVEACITTLMQVLGGTTLRFEVIAVDDGSTDGTLETLLELQEKLPELLEVISHPYNKGNGAAVRTGIMAARGKLIACMDADGQHDPRDLLKMLPFTREYDLVVGERTQPFQGVWYRSFGNKFYNLLASRLTGFAVKDLTSGYRLFRASIVRQYLHLFPTRFSYPTTSTLAFIKGSHNLKYVPVTVRPRQGNNSKITLLGDGWRFLIIIFKIVVIFEPLRVFLPVAATLFSLGLASFFYSVWVLGRLYIPNSSVLLFLASVLILLLGFIAEQIAVLQVGLRNGRPFDEN